tara:strand:+ start:1012 stop:1494 length:483 start_codon:yes stop_codon:yes gene_type:complete
MLNFYSIFFLIIFSVNLSSEGGIFGYWLTSGSIVKIETCNNSICGEIATVFTEEGVDPESILDENNKDKSKRERPIVGINILSDFSIEKSDQKIFKGGKIYDPRSGNTYKSNLYLNEDGTLKVEGCLAFICDGEEWQPLIVKIKEDGTKEAILKNSPRNN